MLSSESIATLLIVIITGLISFQGFQNPNFLNQYVFRVNDILKGKQYVRLISAGFLHADLVHLAFNMISFYSFGGILEQVHGSLFLCVVYGVSLLGGNLLSLWLHRNEKYYSALGASGAVSGVILSVIVLFPSMEVNMFFIPIGIPGWLYALVYTIYSIYGMNARTDNIGHDAHLGGAIIGILVTIAWYPFVLVENWIVVAGVFIPSVLFLVFYKKLGKMF